MIEKKSFIQIFQKAKLSEAVKRECTKKERELVRKLARIVFNKWYSETLMENVIVLPEEPSDEHNKSPSPNK